MKGRNLKTWKTPCPYCKKAGRPDEHRIERDPYDPEESYVCATCGEVRVFFPAIFSMPVKRKGV